MHICFLCSEYPPSNHGGVGTFTRQLGQALVARGHHVTVVGSYPKEEAGSSEDEGVRVLRLPTSPLPKTGFLVHTLRLRRALKRLHNEKPIDVLEGPNSVLAYVSSSFPAPKVLRFHGGHRFFMDAVDRRPKLWRSVLEKVALAKADFLAAVSNYNAETNRRLHNLGQRPIAVLPNPVDTEEFRPRPGLEEEGFILYVGTLAEKKGTHKLIEAIPNVLRHFPAARLWLVGRDWYDPDTGESFRARLQRMVPEDVSDRVAFKGAVDHQQIPNLLARASVCVYPSLMEAHPIAWLEALAAGSAIVASNAGPGPELIEDGVSGLLCDPHRPETIARQLCRLLEDDTLRRRLRAAARARAVERFSVEAITPQNEAFFERCVRDWRRSR